MDQIQQLLEPCKQFVKDSIRLVKKCTKPDRKGNLFVFFCFHYLIYSKFLIQSRISKDCHGDSNWLCYHGIYRLFR